MDRFTINGNSSAASGCGFRAPNGFSWKSRRPIHFSFPYGDETAARARDFALAKEAGFKTAVTTRKGVLFPAHRRYLTALPRVSLAGDYQSLTYTALYLSGATFALRNRFREVSAA